MSESEANRAGLVAPWPQSKRDELVTEDDVVKHIEAVADAAIAAGQPHAAWGFAVGVGNWEYLGERRPAIIDAATAVLDRIEPPLGESRRWG